MKISEKCAARKQLFAKLAEQQRNAESRPKPIPSQHKHGKSGDRSGWNKSIGLEAQSHGRRKYTAEDANWRQCVLSRDGHICVVCGSTELLEVDHIKPVLLYPELRFNVENGQTLCHAHHVQTETYGAKIHKLAAVKVETI